MQSVKFVFITALFFCAFFSSCNIFTLTVAETDVGTDFVSSGNTYYTDIPPIVTGISQTSWFTGSNPNYGIGLTITIYGVEFSNNTTVELFNTTNSTSHSPTSIIFITEWQLLLYHLLT